jgi:Cd2+/Zn2+-exporting ATPase
MSESPARPAAKNGSAARFPALLTALCAVSAIGGWLLWRIATGLAPELSDYGGPAGLPYLISTADPARLVGLASVALLGLSYISGSWLPLRASIAALREGGPDINLLMLFAAWGSAILGQPAEGAALLFLFTLSAALETYTMERATRSIDALITLRPDTVMQVLPDGTEQRVNVDTIQPGDVVRVFPGERIGVDGEVTDGTSSVDESTLTGESLPVDKKPGDAVFAGTLSFQGTLLVKATARAGESMLERIVRLVQSAREEKVAIQTRFERWEGGYVYFVIGLTIVTTLAHYLGWYGTLQGDLRASIYAGMVFMVAASPCAVIMSVPAAVLSGLTRAARNGVLFKGGSYLERLAQVQCFVMDKTGTLTYRRPEVVEVLDGNGEPAGAGATQLLLQAASVERFSEHPLAEAVVRAAEARQLPRLAARTFHSHTGQGVHATLTDEQGEVWVGIGNRLLFHEHGVAISPEVWEQASELQQRGLTALIVGSGEGSGVIGIADKMRSEAPAALAALKRQGIRPLVILTGDHQIVGDAIGRAVGADRVLAGMLPEQKMEAVRSLRAEFGALAYMGDGVNDGPALAAADIGIAMGERGTDVALETADVVLMRDDLSGVPFALWLARRTQAAIIRGLIIAFSVIGFLLFSAAFLNIPLWLAVLLHEGSTVLTILSGTLLLVEPYREVGSGE